jgi:hypothetical protein
LIIFTPSSRWLSGLLLQGERVKLSPLPLGEGLGEKITNCQKLLNE